MANVLFPDDTLKWTWMYEMCKCINPSFSAYLPRMEGMHEGMVYSQDAGQHERNGSARSQPSVTVARRAHRDSPRQLQLGPRPPAQGQAHTGTARGLDLVLDFAVI